MIPVTQMVQKTLGMATSKPDCLAPFTYGTNYRPCHLFKGHIGKHYHKSYAPHPIAMTTSDNADEPVVITYDSTGRPNPSATFQKGFEFC